MLPEKCYLSLECDSTPKEPLRLDEIREPISYGLEHAPLALDICSPRDPTPLWSLGSEDSWRKAREDWFITKSSSELQSPAEGYRCPASSPEPIWNRPDQQLPASTYGRKTHVSETPLNGETHCRQGEILPPIGKKYAAVPKEELSNLFRQMCTFDIIVHSEELGQILYNLFSERLASR